MQGSAVLDTSTVVALVVPEEYSEWAEEMVGRYGDLHVLDLTRYEAYNALWKKHVMLGEIGREALKEAVRVVDALLEVCSVHRFEIVKERALEIAVGCRVTVYDAAYLALAEHINGVLVTIDTKLRDRLRSTELERIVAAP